MLAQSVVVFSRSEGQSLKVVDLHGVVHFEDAGRPDDMSRPEIDRQVLRKILLNSLQPDTVIWNKHVTNVETLNNGQHKIVFKDGTSETTDFLVGADGTWSKVRQLLSSVEPTYTGVIFVETRITNPKVAAPHIDEVVGQGSFYALSDNKGLLAQRNGNEIIRVYASLRVPENWPSKYDFTKPQEIRRRLLEVFSGWQPEMLEMLTRSDDYFVPRHIYSLPLDENWITKPGVTVIGDAAHVMTPFAGQGANLAMLDALQLADCIASEDSMNLSTERLRLFEEEMINRARRFSEMSLNNLNLFISDDPIKPVVDLFNSFQPPE